MHNKKHPYIIDLKALVEELIPINLRKNATTSIKQGIWTPLTIGKESSPKEGVVSAIIKAWLFFANSLMSAEFLTCPEYSQELSTIIDTIREAYNTTLNASADGDILNNSPHLHPVLGAIHDLCFELRSKCRLMYIQIKLEKEKGNRLSTLPPLPLQWNNSGKKDEEIKNLVEWLRQLVKGLIEMTLIDFTCHINKTKLKSLHILFDACEQTKIVTALRGATLYNPFTINPSPRTLKNIPYGIPLLDAIRCKCSVVAYQSIFKAKDQTGQGLSTSSNAESLVWGKQYEESPYRRSNKDLYPDNIEYYTEVSKNEHKESLFHFWKSHLHHYNNKIDLPYSELIIRYNSYIDISRNKRQTYANRINQIDSIIKKYNDEKIDIQNINNIISHHIANNRGHIDLPFDFILTSMHAIELAEIKLDDYKDSHTRIDLLRRLLLYFNELKTEYEYINQPYEQARSFEESIFTCDPALPIPFFIASLGCRYIDSDHLEELDIYYNRLLHQYRLEESDTLIADIKQQRDYLTLLGIFAALITLSVSLVESFKLAETIWDYMAMLGGAYVLIALLVIVLYLANRDEKKETSRWIKLLMGTSLAIATSLGILGIGIKSGYIPLKKEAREGARTKGDSDDNTGSPATIVNQMHLEIPKDGNSTESLHSKVQKKHN